MRSASGPTRETQRHIWFLTRSCKILARSVMPDRRHARKKDDMGCPRIRWQPLRSRAMSVWIGAARLLLADVPKGWELSG